MTREEAIKRFETLLLHVDTDCVMGMETTEAINLAIKALEQTECEDAVSRRAVIDVVMKCYDNDELFEVYEYELNELPSAQPEVVRCKDCKYYDQNDHCFLQGAEPEDYCSYAERRTDE